MNVTLRDVIAIQTHYCFFSSNSYTVVYVA